RFPDIEVLKCGRWPWCVELKTCELVVATGVRNAVAVSVHGRGVPRFHAVVVVEAAPQERTRPDEMRGVGEAHVPAPLRPPNHGHLVVETLNFLRATHGAPLRVDGQILVDVGTVSRLALPATREVRAGGHGGSIAEVLGTLTPYSLRSRLK